MEDILHPYYSVLLVFYHKPFSTFILDCSIFNIFNITFFVLQHSAISMTRIRKIDHIYSTIVAFGYKPNNLFKV